MPTETTARRWTIATWLIAHAASDADRIVDALRAVDADAIALQSIREHDARDLADELAVDRVWALSHHPRSRLLPGSGVGLAVMSRHGITESTDVVISDQTSTWSTHRRIAQVAVVLRADHTGYAIGHAVGLDADAAMPEPSAPLVRIVPEQVGVDTGRAVRLPGTATVVDTHVRRPVERASPMLALTFEMPWVQGDFPVG